MKRFFWTVMATAGLVSAQRSEIGVTAGFGAFAATDVRATRAVAVGAEFCTLCSGRLGVFAEYSHLEGVGRRHEIDRFDIVAGGLRVQGGRRVRPFFDVGLAYGVDSFHWYGGRASHGNPGIVLAGGAAIRLRDRLYVRPQFRVYGLWGIHAAIAGGAGVGLRF